MSKPTDCPDAQYNIMLECWHHDPEMRPSFKYLTFIFEDFYVSAVEGYQQPFDMLVNNINYYHNY